MACIEPGPALAPRAPDAVPADARNGGRARTRALAPGPLHRPSAGAPAPLMQSPDYVQMSTAAAITLGLVPGAIHRCGCTRCLNLLLTYPEGCRANCAYCGLARHREAARDYADRNFIRVDWPAARLDDVVARVAAQGPATPFQRMCISMITHPRADADTRAVLAAWTARVAHVPVSILSNPTTMTRADVAALKDGGADIFTVALDACTPAIFARTRGRGVASPHRWRKYWEIFHDARDVFGPEKVGMHLIVGLGESEQECLAVVQAVKDRQGHSHMFCFFPEQGSLMDHLPAPPFDQWRRVQLARYLIDYMGVRLEHMRFGDDGRVVDFGIPAGECAAIVASGLPFRTSGCPGAERADVSACDRPYGDGPPSDVRSYPFAPDARDRARIRRQLAGRAGSGRTGRR